MASAMAEPVQLTAIPEATLLHSWDQKRDSHKTGLVKQIIIADVSVWYKFYDFVANEDDFIEGCRGPFP